MRLSVERLRWSLLAAAVALVVIVVGYVAYGRYQALKRWQKFLAKSGAHFTHEANGVTWSQTENGKTLFTIHAARAAQKSEGVYLLHDAELTLFSRTSPRVDHIYGADFEYDQNTGVARALGEVHMDLQAPEALNAPPTPPHPIRGREGRAPSAPAAPQESTETIHVRTSGLVYVRSLGVAATKEDVEFHYGGIEAHSQGAEFDESASAVHLLGNVRLNGVVHDAPIAMTASKADLDRGNELVAMMSPVVKSGDRTMTATSATAHLRKDGSVETLHAVGHVRLANGDDVLAGDELNAEMNAKSSPQTAVLTGHVEGDSSSATRPMHATAQRVETHFNASCDMDSLRASGGIALTAQEKGTAGDWLARSLSAERIDVSLVPGSKAGSNGIRSMHAQGHAKAQGEQDIFTIAKKGAKPALAGKRITSLAGDDLLASFHATADGKLTMLDHVDGHGHAHMMETGLAGARSETDAESLALVFVPAPLGSAAGATVLHTATESGDVHIRSQAQSKAGKPGAVTTASASTANYDGESETLRIAGDARFNQNGVQVTAQRLSLQQGTGDAEADGSVTTTLASAGSRDSSHVLSERASFAHAANTAEFYGTDAQPAKLWQGPSQVTAATITMDGALGTLSARPATPGGRVSAILPEGSAEPAKPGTPSAPMTPQPSTANGKVPPPRTKPVESRSVHLESHTLDYADKRREAVLTGDVTMHTTTGEVRADRVVVLMKPKVVPPTAPGKAPASVAAVPTAPLAAANPAAGEIDRVIANGAVRMSEPGRTGSGEQLLYMAATGQMVLTGSEAHPPRISDAEQGNVTGQTLVFGSRDNTVVVSGDSKHGRVRTETEVKP